LAIRADEHRNRVLWDLVLSISILILLAIGYH
jgi:hypothetical protein